MFFWVLVFVSTESEKFSVSRVPASPLSDICQGSGAALPVCEEQGEVVTSQLCCGRSSDKFCS